MDFKKAQNYWKGKEAVSVKMDASALREKSQNTSLRTIPVRWPPVQTALSATHRSNILTMMAAFGCSRRAARSLWGWKRIRMFALQFLTSMQDLED